MFGVEFLVARLESQGPERLPGAEGHANLMDGVTLARGGAARRPDPDSGIVSTIDPASFALAKKASQAAFKMAGKSI